MSPAVINADFDVNSVVLDVVKKGVRDIDVASRVLDARIIDSMSSTPIFRLTVHDPDLRLLNSKSLYYEDKKGDRQVRPIDVELENGVVYRLIRVRSDPAGNGRGMDLKLEFEHRVIAWMRQHNRPRKVSRAKMTQAEFILMLVREIKADRLIFDCPELHMKQPRESAGEEERKKLAKRQADKQETDGIRARLGDLGDGGEPSQAMEVKGEAATKGQRAMMDLAVTIGDDLDAPERAELACLAALTTETRATNLAGGDGTSSGPLQVTEPTARGAGLNPRNARAVIKHFYLKGYYGRGGAIELARKNPQMTVHMIAQNVLGSYAKDGSNYQAWVPEAKRNLRILQGTGGESVSGSSSRYYYKQVNYTRGFEGKKENTYQCGTRLAKDVSWRFFVKGRKTVVFASEPTLFKRRARMRITPDHPAVVSGAGDADVNKKTRTFKLEVRMATWQATPGTVIEIEGYGVHDGRYLVDEIDRSLYSPLANVIAKRPENPKREPRPELVSRESSGDGGGLGGLDGELDTGAAGAGSAAVFYRNCTKISDLQLPYLYGGGHGVDLGNLSGNKLGGPTGRGSLSGGLDCSSSICLALYQSDMFNQATAIVSGDFDRWGEAGEGKFFTIWYNGEHVWVQFKKLGRFWRFDTSPYGSGGRGPRMRTGSRPTAGFRARRWPGL
jgi:hypothetical protein